jgi:hypothetical protein
MLLADAEALAADTLVEGARALGSSVLVQLRRDVPPLAPWC